MSNVGYATLTVMPSAKGFASALKGEIDAPMASAGEESGKKSGHSFLGGFKSMAVAGIALAGANMFSGLIGEAAKASDATQKFVSTMSFAGLDTGAITAAKNEAKSYADQTVYDLPTIQNMIAQLASNGVADYTGLTKAAGNLNAVAGGNAETFKSVAMVMTQTAGAGKLTTENWNQLSDAIPGAAGPLMKAMKDAGAYTGNFRDAMAAGEITSEEFNAALQKLGTDPVAVEAAKSTKTFEGAIGNLQATINSGLMSALDALKPALTGAINGIAKGLGATFDWIGNAWTGLHDLFAKGDFTGALGKAFHVEEDSKFVDFLFKIRDAYQTFVAGFSVSAPDIAGQLAGSLNPIFSFGLKAKDLVMKAYFGISDFVAGFTLPKGEIIPSELEGLVLVGSKVRDALTSMGGAFMAFGAAFKAGDGDITSSGFAGTMEAIGGALRQIWDSAGPNIVNFFSTLATTLGPLIPQVLGLWQNLSPLNLVFQSLAPFLPILVNMLAQLATTLAGALGGAIAGVMPAINVLSQTLVGVLGQILPTIIPAIVTMVGMLGQTFAQLVPIVVPLISTIAGFAATLISQLAPILTNLFTAVMPMVVSSFGMLLGAVGPVIQMLAGILIPVISSLLPVVTTVFSVVADVIRNAMQIVQGIIQVVTGIISGNWSQVWSGILNLVGGVWNTIGSLISGAIRVVLSVISGTLSAIAGIWGGIWGGILGFLGGIWGGITSAVSGGIGNVIGFFGGLLGRITGAIGDAGSALWNVGRNIIQGLINGIGSMMGAIGQAIVNLVPGPIVGVFKDLLGIHSPSRVFRGFGVNIGEGLILGIHDMHADVERSVADLAGIPAGAVIAAPDVQGGGLTGAVTAATLAATGNGGPAIVQENHFNTPMSEESYAELAARKLLRAGVGR